ncbi:hypothetical protein WMY93_012927 [Mugilogobius chulae]|uniref:Uncharacterized protein n=1 Tax=Mugilogobius chulae TaxID=88201 RepID=A0AAW0P507_9GOBI
MVFLLSVFKVTSAMTCSSKDRKQMLMCRNSPLPYPFLCTRQEADSQEKQKIEQSIIRSIDVRFNEFGDKLDNLIAGQQILEERIGGVENKAVNHEQRIKVMETSLEELRQQNKTLRSKLSDLEGRSRRNNLKIVGIPEGEEKGRPTDFVSHLIPKLFGAEHFDKPLAVDMAHRSLQPKPPDGSKPRTIIAKIHSLQDKEKIIRLGRQRTVDTVGGEFLFSPTTPQKLWSSDGASRKYNKRCGRKTSNIPFAFRRGSMFTTKGR